MNQADSSVGKWISMLYRYRKSYANRMLDPYGIAGGQYLFLLTIYCNHGASQEKITDHLKIDKTTTAKAVKRLEKDGLVSRSVDEQDKRAYKVYLTEKAEALIPQIKQTMQAWEDLMLEEISEEEYTVLERVLQKMAEKAYLIGR